MYRHFVEIADQVHTPIVLYNVPGRTGCALSVGCVEALSKHKNIRALKEASGSISYAAKVARYITPDFELLSGNDDMIVPIMSLGGSGVISVWANICPAQTAALVNACLKGDYREGARLQLKYLDLINALFIEVNPIPVKAAFKLMGKSAGPLRMPLTEMEPENRERLRAAMKECGLL